MIHKQITLTKGDSTYIPIGTTHGLENKTNKASSYVTTTVNVESNSFCCSNKIDIESLSDSCELVQEVRFNNTIRIGHSGSVVFKIVQPKNFIFLGY